MKNTFMDACLCLQFLFKFVNVLSMFELKIILEFKKVKVTLSFPALPSENLSSGEFADQLPLRCW